jgi:lipopolysaccharide export system protein LptC
MKGALPIAAFGLAVAVLSYALAPRDTNKVALTFEQVGTVENDLTMTNPELTGVGDDGSPFKIVAVSAVQDAPGSDIVKLDKVVADVSLKDGTVLHITAAKGVADTKKHLLDLDGGIHLTSKEGYEARTESASADLKVGFISGGKPIEAEGKFGHLTAQRFTLNQATGQLHFSGNVHMILKKSAPKT